MVNRQDDLKLSLTRNGSFSVRSTYNVILHLQHQINAQETQESKYWIKIWHLKVPYRC